MVTLCAASGYAVHFFPTGQGNVIGNPILPVIKICANPRTVRTMSEHIDVDTSGLLQREITLDQAGDKLLECMLRTANGRLDRGRGAGPPRVRADPAVRERLMADRLALLDKAAMRAARERIAPDVRVTPVMTVAGARRDAAARDLRQCENFAEGGAFKARGACNAVFSLPMTRRGAAW